MRRKSKIHIIGEVPRLVPRKGDNGAVVRETTEMVIMSKREKDTVKRHIVGLFNIFENLDALDPLCRTCYEDRGWLTKCSCKEKNR